MTSVYWRPGLLASDLHDHGEQVDRRTNYQFAHATLELAATARRLGQSAQIETLLEQARTLSNGLHWRLGEVDLLIEDTTAAVLHQRLLLELKSSGTSHRPPLSEPFAQAIETGRCLPSY